MAKYHLSIIERMVKTYESFPDKRTFLGILNEMNRAVESLIRSYLCYGGFGGSYDNFDFFNKVGGEYLDVVTREDLLKTLEIYKAHKISPISYQKNDQIIIIEGGKYRILTFERLKNLIISLKKGVLGFPG
ncbi:MAG: hypothetical protein WC494_01870 [Candidatus Pacearchaeota archaeon]